MLRSHLVMSTTSSILTISLALLFISLRLSSAQIQGKNYWMKLGHEELTKALKVKLNQRTAKNVIVFVGDGMGVNTVTAGRIYKAGEESLLSFENFPHVGMIKTYCTDKQVPDSASTATALFCGVKNNYETLGVTSDVAYGNCEASLKDENRLESIMLWAQEAGKSTGIVTNTRITHATPAATYAKSAARHWECDSRVPANSGCKDIARQLVEDSPGKNFNVILGGGLQCMTSGINITKRNPIENSTGLRADGMDLIEKWAQDKRNSSDNVSVAYNTSDLSQINPDTTDYLIGIFSNSHMPFEYKRDKSESGTPSLSQMSTTAVNILKKNDNGFFLMVEGGMIDQAHHLGIAKIAMDEVVEFSDAINSTVNLLEKAGILDDTLIIVTSDHGHTLSINGYPDKGSSILGIATKSKVDGVPWTTLTYGVGTKANYQFKVVDGKVQRQDPRNIDTTSYNFRQLSLAQHDLSAHGGGDVIAYAKGPMAHLLHSVHEQSYITYIIAFASEIGPYQFEMSVRNSVIPTTPSMIINLLIPLFITVIINCKV